MLSGIKKQIVHSYFVNLKETFHSNKSKEYDANKLDRLIELVVGKSQGDSTTFDQFGPVFDELKGSVADLCSRGSSAISHARSRLGEFTDSVSGPSRRGSTTVDQESSLLDSFKGSISDMLQRSADSVSKQTRFFSDDVKDSVVVKGRDTFSRRVSEPFITTPKQRALRRVANRSLEESSSAPVLESISASAAVNPKLFLMGGIETTPVIPTKRRTSIPLSMHQSEYKAMLERRGRQWSANSERNGAPGTPDHHVCPYINGAEICRICTVNQKHATFLAKLGKIFVVNEYVEDEGRIRVIVSQFGNPSIFSNSKDKKPNISIQLKATFASGKSKTVVKRLDWFKPSEQFRYNYLAYFDCQTEEVAKKAKLQVKLKYKRAFYKKYIVLASRCLDLNDIQTDPEQPEEYSLY